MLELEVLIEKFWKDQTTPAENERLIQLLEQYKGVYKGMMQEDFQKKLRHPSAGLRSDRAMDLLDKLHKDLRMEEPEEKRSAKKGSARKWVRPLAVAASVGFLAVSVFLLPGRHQESKPIVRATAPPAPPSPRVIRMVNGPDSVMPIALKDGSTVQLAKNSSLSWYEPFINDRRDLTLTGSALFKVAKDRSKPFTVYAGGIATRALGTKFWVNATDVRKVMVQLLEGKVVVHSAAESDLTLKDVYLTPGQEFSYDMGSRQYAVNAIPGALPGKPDRAPKRVLPDYKEELVFRKESLGKVFQKIGLLYKIPLDYRQEELQGLYFTGTFLKSDDLDIVLSAICNVNNLVFTKEKDSIIITRAK